MTPPATGLAGLRVALVHDWLTGMRGGEKVLEAIAGAFPEAPIFTLFHFPGSVSPAIEAHPVVPSFLQRLPGVRLHYRRYLPLFPVAIEDFDLSGYDLVVSTSHCVAKGAIPAPGAKHLCYCHTPMRYAWDQEHAYFPRRRGAGARLRGLVLSALRTWDAASAPRVDRFAANSRFVAERIRRYYGREAVVLPPPVDTEFFTPAAPGSRDAYALAVSAPAPYKRLDLAIQACEQAGIPLIIVGDGPGLSRLRRTAGSGVDLRGRVEGPELRELYRGAICLVQPGIEDFGIAPVEALACGTPVVALGRGGVLDIVDDGVHGVLAAPAGDDRGRVRALAAAIDKARGIRFNSSELRLRAEGFSLDRFREAFLALVDDLLSRAPGREGAGP
ncbi:MAG TPA: glycosyltransferase [Thermoanaerobaculia bacterium]|nr:glycosyltransferase [Thermoanaerobaculia bacterium]